MRVLPSENTCIYIVTEVTCDLQACDDAAGKFGCRGYAMGDDLLSLDRAKGSTKLQISADHKGSQLALKHLSVGASWPCVRVLCLPVLSSISTKVLRLF
jgi:hypothetical protein